MKHPDAAETAETNGHPAATVSAEHEAPVACAAVPLRRIGGRPLDAGRVLEIAKDPVTGCASRTCMPTPVQQHMQMPAELAACDAVLGSAEQAP